MRLNNRNKIGFFIFLSTLLVMISLFGIVGFLLERFQYNYLGFSSILFLLIPLVFITIFYLRGRQIFEYDSDGEALNFKNRNVLPYLSRPISDEFPKYKLQNYEILNGFIFKRLYINIASKKYHTITLRYDISYLSKKELNDLKFSLSKVIKNNKERENS
jgi:hypothetical protein